MPGPRTHSLSSWRARGSRRPEAFPRHGAVRTFWRREGRPMTKHGIGSSPRRREDHRLVTGAGTFGDDVAFSGQTFAAIARSPHAHAVIRRIDTTQACRVPGVVAVLTAADYLADGLKPLVHSPFTISPPDITLPNRDGKAVFIAPHYPLARDRVRFVGEGVALVVAESLATAREDVELVEVE